MANESVRAQPALRIPREKDSQGTAWRLRAPPTGLAGEAAWNRPRAQSLPCLFRTLDQLAILPALFSDHSPNPRRGSLRSQVPALYSVAKRTSFSSGQIDSLLTFPVPSPMGRRPVRPPVQMGPAQRPFSCKKATADWNHVVGISQVLPASFP